MPRLNACDVPVLNSSLPLSLLAPRPTSVSGNPPQVPVVSTRSGLVYEAKLARQYVAENGKDPVTGAEMGEDDLVEIKLGE